MASITEAPAAAAASCFDDAFLPQSVAKAELAKLLLVLVVQALVLRCRRRMSAENKLRTRGYSSTSALRRNCDCSAFFLSCPRS